MKSLAPILNLIALAWWRTALRQMGADHPDCPMVVLKINALESK